MYLVPGSPSLAEPCVYKVNTFPPSPPQPKLTGVLKLILGFWLVLFVWLGFWFGFGFVLGFWLFVFPPVFWRHS